MTAAPNTRQDPPNMTDTDDPLLALIVTILTPLLTLSDSATDATRAARQALAAYKAAGHDQLITIAQIVAFAFAGLDNLRLSAAPDLSLSMKLKLRGNANALNRSTQRNTRELEIARLANPILPDHEPTPLEAFATPENPPPSEPVTPKPDQPRQRIWAEAMTDVAAECSRNLNRLPPAQRRAEIIRIAALNETARHLNQAGAARTKSSRTEQDHAERNVQSVGIMPSNNGIEHFDPAQAG